MGASATTAYGTCLTTSLVARASRATRVSVARTAPRRGVATKSKKAKTWRARVSGGRHERKGEDLARTRERRAARASERMWQDAGWRGIDTRVRRRAVRTERETGRTGCECDAGSCECECECDAE